MGIAYDSYRAVVICYCIEYFRTTVYPATTPPLPPPLQPPFVHARLFELSFIIHWHGAWRPCRPRWRIAFVFIFQARFISYLKKKIVLKKSRNIRRFCWGFVRTSIGCRTRFESKAIHDKLQSCGETEKNGFFLFPRSPVPTAPPPRPLPLPPLSLEQSSFWIRIRRKKIEMCSWESFFRHFFFYIFTQKL